jgi:CubicO group peptidase (beta-lactamase class C family)
VDYSKTITIQQLLAHTSGLPDYFQGKGPNGKSLEEELMSGNDQFFTFEEAIQKSKKITPLFAPDTP